MSSVGPTPLAPTLIVVSAGLLGLVGAKIGRVSPIVTFFVIGALCGPYGFCLSDDNETALKFLSELGIAFLLFDIGLHLSIKELREQWRGMLGSGLLQFLFVTLGVGGALMALGLNVSTSVALGAILSLSSTALILKILAEQRESSSPVGNRTTQVLVFQDVVAILLLVILGSIGDGLTVSSIALPIAKMVGAAIGMVVIGKIVLNRVFRFLVALKSDEIFTAFTVFLVLLTSWITESLGLSLALGAFLGGLALSESGYSHMVRSELAPFRGLLLSLFFLVVGMGFNFYAVLAAPLLVLGLLVGFVAVKGATSAVAMYAVGMERGAAIRIGFLLAQGSEFAFVLVGVAMGTHIIESKVAELAIAVVGLSLAATPGVIALGCSVSRSACSISEEGDDVAATEAPEVIIVEFDDFAHDIASCLIEAAIPYRGHDRDMDRLSQASSEGFNVFFSDPNRPRTLSRVSAKKALAVVCLLEDDDIIALMVPAIRKHNPEVPIIAASSDPKRLELLNELGITNAYLKRPQSLGPLVDALFTAIGRDPSEAIKAVATLSLSHSEPVLFPRGQGEMISV